ncbi:uncharacterized protein N7469_004184 [Penicillium citrinum]|uniref:Uncharacterized protein n=1 Tax=Penicillium citrinum TaxID=5077 RepID=A0A9W9P4B6_PENCI|nr:uncharacterized protein N7469_004184 [Penicillium citrinum]KAJ5235016.1 hypothetical protein N7469_004184 [Penicillium citrinum]
MILKVQLALKVGALCSLQKEIDRMSELAGVRGTVPPRRSSRTGNPDARAHLFARPDIMRAALYSASEIFKRNKHYWPMLTEPEEAISKPLSPMYMMGSPEEA